MKKIFFLILTFLISISYAQAQTGLTNYGVSSGTKGNSGSYFGYFSAGNMTGSVTGSENSFFGGASGRYNTSGSNNSAMGYVALHYNSSGSNNVAMGFFSLFNNTASNNTALGADALRANTSGSSNTSTGYQSLYSNTTASYNTALGYQSLYSNTTAFYNTALGYQALYSNTTGANNNALGYQTLLANTTGSQNIAFGTLSLGNNTTGSYNSAMGDASLSLNTTGSGNTAYGIYALTDNIDGTNNCAFGNYAGPDSQYSLTNSTAIGSNARTTASNQVRIGNTNVTSIGGQVGWTTLSDGRFKTDIKEDISGLVFINQLRPVSYFVNKAAFDKFLGKSTNEKQQAIEEKIKPIRRSGFIAQEVEEVSKKLGIEFSGIDAPKNEKDYYGLRYDEFVVPLVKAVQELSSVVQEQQKKIDLLLNQLDKTSSDSKGVNENKIELFQNAPNPFTTDTEIKMQLPEKAADVNLIVYNLEGKQLKQLKVTMRGNAVVKISGNELSAGMYIYALMADGKVVDTKRMILTE